MDNEESDSEREIYLKSRKDLVNAEYSESEAYDKLIITLSSSAFGLSILFIRFIVPDGAKEDTSVWISVAWSLLIFSMLSTLISKLFSQYAFKRAVEILDVEYEFDDDDNDHKNNWTKATQICNWLSMVFFTFGAISLTIFSVLNIEQ